MKVIYIDFNNGLLGNYQIKISWQCFTILLQVITETFQTLAKYFGEANAIWIIEDFHKINTEEKTKLSQVMKIFMDMSEKYNSVKIIALGAVNTAREVVQYDPEMRNRVAEIHIPLMSKDELQEIIQVGTKLLNFAFSKDVSEKIAIYSCGMASVTHQLSLLICENEEVETTLNVDRKADDKSLDVAIDEYISETSDSLKHIYDIAVKCFCRILKKGFYIKRRTRAINLKIFKNYFRNIGLKTIIIFLKYY